MTDYVDEIAAILDDMRFSLEQMVAQTAAASTLMDSLQGTARFGYVSFKRAEGDWLAPDLIHIIEGGRIIGNLSVESDLMSRSYRVHMTVLGKAAVVYSLPEQVMQGIVRMLADHYYLIPEETSNLL